RMLYLVVDYNALAITSCYSISLHDALPICSCSASSHGRARATSWDEMSAPPPFSGARTRARASDPRNRPSRSRPRPPEMRGVRRSEEHTSELQSRENLVCRLLLEKKKKQYT